MNNIKDFSDVLLQIEQRQLLIALVEAQRRIPRADCPYFMSLQGGFRILHPGLQNKEREAYVGDIDTLENSKLIQFRNGDRHDLFSITPLGFSYYEYLRSTEQTGLAGHDGEHEVNYEKILLTSDQLKLLRDLNEIVKAETGNQTNQFLFTTTFAGSQITSSEDNIIEKVNRTDVEELRRQNLINFTSENIFYLTPQGMRYCEYIMTNTSPTTPPATSMHTPNARAVFVVHGRNGAARDAVFAFLRSLDLKPLEWEAAVRLTGKAAPYIGEVLDAAFGIAQAVVVVLSGDDEAKLRTTFHKDNEETYETKLTPQARPNVLFEAGMAFGRSADRTILLQIGDNLRPFSDVAGRHTLRCNGSQEDRIKIAERLRTAGCSVDQSDTNWLVAGDFEAALKVTAANEEMEEPAAQSTPRVSISSSGNPLVPWAHIINSPKAAEKGDSTTFRVPGIGEVFVSKRDFEFAQTLGDGVSVELYDATAAASPMPQYCTGRFIP